MFLPVFLSYIHPSIQNLVQCTSDNLVSYCRKTIFFSEVFPTPPSLQSLQQCKISNTDTSSVPLFLSLIGSSPDCCLLDFVSDLFDSASSSLKVQGLELLASGSYKDLGSLKSITNPLEAQTITFHDYSKCALFFNSHCFEEGSLVLFVSDSLIILSSPPGSSVPSTVHSILPSHVQSQCCLSPIPHFGHLNPFYVNLCLFHSTLPTSYISHVFLLLEQSLQTLAITSTPLLNRLTVSCSALQAQINDYNTHIEDLDELYHSTANHYNNLASNYNDLQSNYLSVYESYHCLALETLDFDAFSTELPPPKTISNSIRTSSLPFSPLGVRGSGVISPPPFDDRRKSNMAAGEMPRDEALVNKTQSKRRSGHGSSFLNDICIKKSR
ncbi:hypothetical protein GEMRC1_006553 [Eukaryota sp. GEM-RC1]